MLIATLDKYEDDITVTNGLKKDGNKENVKEELQLYMENLFSIAEAR